MLEPFVFTYITSVERAHTLSLDVVFCQLAVNTRTHEGSL